MGASRWGWTAACTAGAVLHMAGPGQAATPSTARWLPNTPNASWVYGWSSSGFSQPVTRERYTVAKRSDTAVELRWTTKDTASDPGAAPSEGSIDYRYTESGLVNTNWSSTPPPPQFPILCASATNCGNSLAGAHYQLIWGSRSPLIQEPLLRGAEWSSLGGQGHDVASTNRYRGRERVTVPAFPRGVFAAKVESDITQAGALGDPYGSGVRTTWWVYGVGPVKVDLRHASGHRSVAVLEATNLKPRNAPTDRARFPLQTGSKRRYRYTNTKHMKRASVQEFTVGRVVNSSARVDVRNVSGPIRVRGSYVFSAGRSGITNLSVGTSTATRVKFPKLGPRSQPAKRRRHFFTPMDLAVYGINPVLPAYPRKGDTWKTSKSSRDYKVYGVTGRSKVIGNQRVRTPAGRFTALLVETKMTQKGYRFGSGVRKSWFAPGVGLVKLQFRHRDGSVSKVDLLKR